MENKLACIFPGQGSQWVGMGADLYHDSPAAKEVFEQADSTLGFHLSRLCFEGPQEELALTINSQPAILTVSVACLEAATEREKGVKPDYVAGHSLGEYTALVAAGVLDFPSTLRLVRERGRLMQEAGDKQPGGMAAIIGLDEVMVEQICLETGAEIANVNCDGQIVVSGRKEALARAIDLARASGAKRAIPLEVSAAFHSSLMRPATEQMSALISSLHFHPPTIPIVVNTTARPVVAAEELKEELLRQLCGCVHWQRSVEYMIKRGVSTFVEVGPGQVLSGLVKRIGRGVKILTVGSLASIIDLKL